MTNQVTKQEPYRDCYLPPFERRRVKLRITKIKRLEPSGITR